MATYLTLWKWTEQGARGAKASPDRAQAFKTEAGRHGIKVVEFMWTQGRWDAISVFDRSLGQRFSDVVTIPRQDVLLLKVNYWLPM